ncbi:MAG: efflux RND transporter periplasmic adaptor subunit [Candidatus Andersenbacteria bacterium]|nr:efflux RND transporter periplasmic adaptor subunit [Candidatus Andersenbacteria bacterium]MBI3250840.1 efflux RND transporter periplasmic adaptor subunit [Candidatus Andersenbacteria bacterium]
MKIPYRNPWLISAVVIAVVAGGWWWYSSNTTETSTTPTTETVTKGTLVQSVTGTGSVLAKIQADVSVSGQGRVEQLLVKDGDVVRADQALLKIKSLATAEDIAKAYASLLSAQGAVTDAQQRLQDTQKNENIEKTTLAASQLAYDQAKIAVNQPVIDADKGVIGAAITQEAADTALKTVSAERGTQSAKIDLQTATLQGQENLKTADVALQQSKRDTESAALKTKSAQQSYNASAASLTASRLSYQALTSQTLTAPVGGTIMNLSLVEGSTVGSSNAASSSDTGSSGSSTSLFSIIDLMSLRAQVAINEIDIASVEIGQPATLTFDALPDKTLTGSVVGIDRLGTTTSGVTTYNVEIGLDMIDESIRPGMTASASIITEQKNDVLLVPSAAVSTQNDQDSVQIMRDGAATTITVTIGANNDTHTEIIDGLQEGDQIITSQGTGTTSGAFSAQTQQGNGGGPGGGAIFR